MSKVEIVCCPPDLAEAALERCEKVFLRGLSVCPDLDRAELTQRLRDRTALLWMVLKNNELLALGFTEIVADDDAVAVFGLSGRNMWQWAKPFAATITAYARDEGVQRVLFAGSKAWGRVIPHAHAYGTRDGQQVFERRTLQ